MFQKLVAIEPVSLVPSAEKALYSFAGDEERSNVNVEKDNPTGVPEPY